jgi:hypothetical protein
MTVSQVIRTFSGREFTPEDIEHIKWTRATYPGLSRSELAGTICQIIGWTTPAGMAKNQQCKAFLEELEKEGVITLPPAKKQRPKKVAVKIAVMELEPEEELHGEVRDYERIKLKIAEPGNGLKRWRSYVNQYHMLGDKWVFGSRLQYFVMSGNKELGCLQFSASAWSLEERDKWIGWTVEDRKKRLHLIINNSRFLIFPWVHIRNLASKSLSIAARQIQEDWLRQYCYAPVLLETFVDKEHFEGVCYKAANWEYLGETKGSGRNSAQEDLISRKMIFMYPLQKDFKAILRGEKPYKVVDPE